MPRYRNSPPPRGGRQVRGELLLEGCDLAAEEEDTAVENVLDRPVDLGLDLAILGAQLQERNRPVSQVVLPMTPVVLDGTS